MFQRNNGKHYKIFLEILQPPCKILSLRIKEMGKISALKTHLYNLSIISGLLRTQTKLKLTDLSAEHQSLVLLVLEKRTF